MPAISEGFSSLHESFSFALQVSIYNYPVALESHYCSSFSSWLFSNMFFQSRETGGVGEEYELEDTAAELFAEAQARAREQAAYEQLKASGKY